MKARVDTVYLNSLANYTEEDLPPVSPLELPALKAELQKEVEELRADIASVAEVVVAHELRKPISDIKERKQKDKVQAQSAWLKYVCPVIFSS